MNEQQIDAILERSDQQARFSPFYSLVGGPIEEAKLTQIEALEDWWKSLACGED